MSEPVTYTYREYLVLKTLQADPSVSWPLAFEAVASSAIEHPEWDMDAEHTWNEWEAQ